LKVAQSQGPGLLPQDRNGSNAIKLGGFRMSARIERERVQLPTRTELDWSHKYPSVVEALVKVGAKTLAITPQSGLSNSG
jgi:ATP-dependent DNA ligase